MAKKNPGRMRKAVILVILVAIILMSSLWLLLNFAEHRTKDFIIDNYLMDKGIYSDRGQAEKGVEIISTHWGFETYCMKAVAYVGEGSTRISTTLVLSVPVVPYVLNLDSAGASIIMVGEC